MLIPKKLKTELCLMILALGLWFLVPVIADAGASSALPSWESQRYIIEGVYYLINKGDLNTAEELFRKAILSSSFEAVSRRTGERDRDRHAVAEAFYFLGKIYYERAKPDIGKESQESSIQYSASRSENLAWAKKHLEKAEEYGIIYDRLHPPLLDEINRKHPEIKIPVLEPNRDKARVVIETDPHGLYRVNAVKVDQYTSITETRFSINKELDLECGARYKLEPDIRGGYRTIYGTLAILGIGLAIWVTRN